MAYTQVKTPIVYYGGKTAILSHILPMIPEHEVYTECFFGGGAVFWAKHPVKNETINDRLDLVVNFYRCLRGNFKSLKKLVDATLISRKIHNEALTCIRAHKNKSLNDYSAAGRVRLAWAFWVCTNFAYSNKLGGGYKYSNDMSVAVPGTLRKRKENFTEMLAQRIEHAYIENDDALKILASRNVKKAFHYLDPPYPNADQGHYAGYTFSDYEALLTWLANDCKGLWLLSSYNSAMLTCFINEMGWHKREITHRIGGARVSNPRKNRESRTECLVSNYRSACRTLDLFENEN